MRSRLQSRYESFADRVLASLSEVERQDVQAFDRWFYATGGWRWLFVIVGVTTAFAWIASRLPWNMTFVEAAILFNLVVLMLLWAGLSAWFGYRRFQGKIFRFVVVGPLLALVGATLGAVPPVPEYFPKIRAICDRYEVLFIADEVMTGFGRTGANFAVDHWGVIPDLIATAKGVSGGYIPLGAVIVRDELMRAFERNQSNFVGGHTYTGHPVAAAVGLAVLRYIQEHDLVRNAREVGAHLLAGLRGLQARHPIIGDVRGLGMMVGLEFVADRMTRAPFPAEREVARAIALEALPRGLVTYPGTGSVDGVLGDHTKLTPPLILTRAQADEIVSILDASIGAVEARL